MLNQNKVYTVTEVNTLLKAFIDNNSVFNFMLVSGEIVNFKRHSSGHLYFSLKDATDRVKCVMFNRQSRLLSFRPMDGMQVLVQGRLSVYTKSGEYQVYVDSIHRMGVGNLHVKFLELKERLEKLGYFDKDVKKDIIRIPQKIGVVTSATGAAIHDIIRTVKNKYPPAQIILAPAKVQGLNSANEIANAIELLNSVAGIDTIIVGRGGGATEELWSFNEEVVIKAIRESRVPIVSAVGHEIDTTLADLAADAVAPTPTAAGEIVVPDIYELQRDCDLLYDKLALLYRRNIGKKKNIVNLLLKNLSLAQPEAKINQKRNRLNYLQKSLQLRFDISFQRKIERVAYLTKRLNELNPQLKLAKGYALVYNEEGNVINSIHDVNSRDSVVVKLYDGSFTAEVKNKEVNKNE